MAKNLIQCGDVIDWTNGTGNAVVSGQVVVIGSNGDALIAIALVDIANGATGSVRIDDGVFEVPKVSAAVIAAGETVAWDASAAAFDDNQMTPATGDVTKAAVAVEAAGAGVTTVKIRLTGVAGVLH